MRTMRRISRQLIMKGKNKGEMIKRVGNLGNLSPCYSSNESYQNSERAQSKLFRQEELWGKVECNRT